MARSDNTDWRYRAATAGPNDYWGAKLPADRREQDERRRAWRARGKRTARKFTRDPKAFDDWAPPKNYYHF